MSEAPSQTPSPTPFAKLPPVSSQLLAELACVSLFVAAVSSGTPPNLPSSPTSPGSPYQGSQEAANTTVAFNGLIGGDENAYILILQSGITAQDDFWIQITLPLDATATTSSQELGQYSLWVGNAPPVPAVAGTPLAWQQFSVSPAPITLTAGYSFGIAAAYYVGGNDPLGVPLGRYVECSVYAGSQLIGSGSNALIANLPGGPGTPGLPGVFCTPANHGADSWGASFPITSLQPGTTYTIVWSLLSS